MSVVLLAFCAVIVFLLGLVVFIQQPRRLPILFFFIANISATIWTIGLALFIGMKDASAMVTIAASYYIAAAAIVCFMLLFALTFAAHQRLKFGWYVAILVPFLAISATLAINPHALISTVTIAQPNTATLHMPIYIAYSIYFVAYYTATLSVLYRRSLHPKNMLRGHYQHMFYAYLLAGVTGIIFNLILPATGNYTLVWIGPLGLLMFVPIVSIAIARYGLFDVRRAAVRSSAYFLSLVMLGVIYYVIAYIISITLSARGVKISTNIDVANIAIALVLAYLFQPIKDFFDRITSNIFYRNDYSTEDFFARINRTLTSTTEVRRLLSSIAREVGSTLKSEHVLLFAYHTSDRYVSAGTKSHMTLTLKEAQALDMAIMKNGFKLIETRDMKEHSTAYHLLVTHGIALVLPLERDGRVVGYLALGDRRSGYYSTRDIRALETIADGLVIAIQNAFSVQEINEFNATLQQRIDDATKELRSSNEKLQRLDVAKDEFVSMASHQLRTPLTSVKGYISMVLDGDVGKITKEQRQLLEEAFTSSERMVHLIGDFLNVSRLQTGKFIIDRHACDLAKITEQEVEGMRQIAETHNISITYKKPARFPELYIDENKIRQVVMNFMDNAIYYSPESKVIKVSLAIEESDAVLRVTDHGMGVPLAVQKKLFTKFFRAENARKQRPDGTGIGLFLARKVIDGHNGNLVFESTEGKGSTFGFRLPIKKLSTPPEAEQIVE